MKKGFFKNLGEKKIWSSKIFWWLSVTEIKSHQNFWYSMYFDNAIVNSSLFWGYSV